MSTNENLKGKINGVNMIHGYSAYEIAVMHGFEGTEEEWLDSLTQETADKAEAMIAEQKAEALASIEAKQSEVEAMLDEYIDNVDVLIGGDG